MKAVKLNVEKIFVESIQRGIFCQNTFNQKLMDIWQETNDSEVDKNDFIEVVTDVVGPCVHFVDFSKLKKAA